MAHGVLGVVKTNDRQERAPGFFQTVPECILSEVITVTKVVGSVRTIYRGSVGSLVALGVLTPPEA